MKALFALILFVLFSINGVLAQDAHFSQPHLAPLATNPALAGVMSGNHRLATNLRRQWASVAGSKAWEQLYASYDLRHCLGGGSFLAFGAVLAADRAGSPSFSNTSAALSFAYHGKLGSGLYLSAGATAGLLQYRLGTAGMSFDEQFAEGGYDASLPNFEQFEASNRMVPDLSAGLLLFSPKAGWTAGAALHHVNQPAYSFFDEDANRLGMGVTLHSSATLAVNRRSGFVVRGLYRRQSVFQNSRQWQLLPGATWRRRLGENEEALAFGTGVSVRLSGHAEGRATTMDAVVPAVFFEVGQLSLGFSYDVNTSPLAKASYLRGAWEVGVSWQIQGEAGCVVCPGL